MVSCCERANALCSVRVKSRAEKNSRCLMSNTQNHYFGGFDERSSSLPGLQLHFPRRARGDDRCDLLTPDRNLYYRHQAAHTDSIDSSDKLITSANAADHQFAFLLRFAPRSEKQPVQFALRDAMVSPRRANAAQLFLVDPLLNRGEADSQLQSRVPQL